MSEENAKWYLSFDCALKSIAFAIIRIIYPDDNFYYDLIKVDKMLKDKKINNELLQLLTKLNKIASTFIKVFDGDVSCLIDTKRNINSVPIVEHTYLVAKYVDFVNEKISKLNKFGCPAYNSKQLNVGIENQMGPNNKSNRTAIGLFTRYWECTVFPIGPLYKNGIYFPSDVESRHCMFLGRYTTYTANKKHTRYLYFEKFIKLFEDSINIKLPLKHQPDFADCVFQILGLLKFSSIKEARTKF